MTKKIWVTTSFVGWHCWPKAPASVAFLRNNHRHVFHVKATFIVQDSDRELEFFTVKDHLESTIRGVSNLMDQDSGSTSSCESIAEVILHLLKKGGFSVYSVEVSEDGENGAIVTIC